MKRLKILSLIAIIGLSWSTPLRADKDWTLAPPGSGSMNDPANWGGACPTGSEFAYIRNGGTATLDTNYVGNTLPVLVVGDSGGNGTINQTGGLLDISGAPHACVLIGGLNGGACTGTYNISGGTLRTWDGTADAGRIYLGYAGGTGFLNVSDGLVQTRGLCVGYLGASALNQTGGTVNLRGGMGTTPSGDWGQTIGLLASGYYGISDGTLNISSAANADFIVGFATDGPGVFEQTGGTVTMSNSSRFLAGYEYATYGKGTGVVNLLGGSFTSNNSSWAAGIDLYYGNGVLNVGGGAQVDLKGSGTVAGYIIAGGAGNQVVNLGDGTVKAGFIKGWNDAVNSVLNLHGCTILAQTSTDPGSGGGGSSTAYMDGFTNAYVYSEGATFHVDAGQNAVVNQNLATPAGSKGLIDAGLTITGGSGYISPPVVTITPAEGDYGAGATAYAVVSGGQVTDIVVTNPGTGYTLAPTFTLSGGGGADASVTGDNTLSLADNVGGGLTKTGPGTLTLGGWNSYTSATSVEEGTLAVTGSIAGDVDVSKDAALGGNGYVYGAVTIQGDSGGGGTINPGTSIGTLYVSSLTLQDNTNLFFDLSSTEGADQLVVSSGDVVEDPTNTSINVHVNFAGSTGSYNPVTLVSVTSGALDPHNKITFSLPTPTLDSFDGTTSTQATLQELAAALQLTPAGPFTDPTWNTTASGATWSTSGNWTGTNPPPLTGGQRALFTAALASGPVPVTLDVSPTLSSMIFSNPGGESYTISPVSTESITLDSSIATDWHITVLGGAHAIEADLKLAKGTDQSIIRLNGSTQLTLGGVVGDLDSEVPARLAVDGLFNGSTGDKGILVLGGANTYTGPTLVANAVLEIPSVDIVANPNPLGQSGVEPENFLLDNSTLRVGSAGGATDRGVTFSGDVTLQTDGNVSFSGQTVATGTTVTKTGSGALTFNNTAAQTNGLGNTVTVVEGTLNFDLGAETVYNAGHLLLGAAGGSAVAVNQTGGTISLSDPNFPYADVEIGVGAPATYNLTDGALLLPPGGRLYVGLSGANGVLNVNGASQITTQGFNVGWNGPGAYYQSGGTTTLSGGANAIDSDWSQVIGNSAYGYVQVSGGTLKFNDTANGNTGLGVYDTGIINQTGGTVEFVNPNNFYVAGSQGVTGAINITGGTMLIEQRHAQTDGYGILLGYPGTGILNVGGAGTLDLLGAGTAKEMLFVGVSDGTYAGSGIVNLGTVGAGGGAILNAGLVKGWGGPATFNFHGGTLNAAESTDVFDDGGVQGNENDASFMDGFTNAYIYSEGAKITVAAGHSSQIDQVFEDPTGYGLTAELSSLTPGSGYVAPPLVTFFGGSAGSGATANAVINEDGEVTGIVITNPGVDYQLNDPSPIEVAFSGGGGDGAAVATINMAQLVQNVGGTFEKLGDGELYLTAANKYSGATLVKGGTLKIADIQNGGVASPIGKSSAAPGNLVLDGGTLYYAGPGQTTDRGLTVGPGNGTVKTDNHLTLAGDVVEGDDGGLNKDGLGVLTLTGNLTYTGATDIKAGLLEIAHTGDAVNLPGGIASSTQTGDLAVLDGVDLTTPSIAVRALTIGGSGVAPAPAPVPEPGTWLLLALAGLTALAAARRKN